MRLISLFGLIRSAVHSVSKWACSPFFRARAIGMKKALGRRFSSMSVVMPSLSNRKCRPGAWNGEFRMGFSMVTGATVAILDGKEALGFRLWVESLFQLHPSRQRLIQLHLHALDSRERRRDVVLRRFIELRRRDLALQPFLFRLERRDVRGQRLQLTLFLVGGPARSGGRSGRLRLGARLVRRAAPIGSRQSPALAARRLRRGSRVMSALPKVIGVPTDVFHDSPLSFEGQGTRHHAIEEHAVVADKEDGPFE